MIVGEPSAEDQAQWSSEYSPHARRFRCSKRNSFVEMIEGIQDDLSRQSLQPIVLIRVYASVIRQNQFHFVATITAVPCRLGCSNRSRRPLICAVQRPQVLRHGASTRMIS
jgi:hypothetical protein